MQHKNTYVLFKTTLNSPNYTSNCFEPISYSLPQGNPRNYEHIISNPPNTPNTSNIVTPLLHFSPIKSPVFKNLSISDEKTHNSLEASNVFHKTIANYNLEDEFRSKLNFSNYDNKKTKSGKNRVKFDPVCNKIIMIQGLSFYNENNIKKDVWWTFAELNTMRSLLTVEVNRTRMANPNWSIQQCIREICKK